MKPVKPKTCATDSLLLAARLRIPSAGPTCSMYIEAVTRCHIAGLIKKYASAHTHTFFLKVCYCPRRKQKGLELRAPCLNPLSSGDQDEKMLYRHRSKVGWGGVSCAAHAYLTSVRTNAAQKPCGRLELAQHSSHANDDTFSLTRVKRPSLSYMPCTFVFR